MQFGGSKYRHVVGKEFAREMSYPDMRPNKDLTEVFPAYSREQ